MWLDGPSGDFGVDTVHTGSTTISAKDIADFNAAILRPKSATASVVSMRTWRQHITTVSLPEPIVSRVCSDPALLLRRPQDFTTVAAWQPLIKSLFAREIQGNLLRLVHLSHKYKLLGTGAVRAPLAEGETITSAVSVASVLISPGGKEITAVGTLQRGGAPFVEITSKFFIRGEFIDYAGTFKKSTDQTTVELKTAADAAVLMAKSWFIPANGEVQAGDVLILKTTTHEQYSSASVIASAAAPFLSVSLSFPVDADGMAITP